MSVKLNSFINIMHKPNDYVLNQVHDVYEIVLYASGEGFTTIDGKIANYQKGSMAIIRPNAEHDERAESETEVFCLMFQLNDVQVDNGVIQLSESTFKLIYEYFCNIRVEYLKRPYNYEKAINCFLELILIEIERQNIIKDVNHEIKAFEYARLYIKENYSTIINFSMIAKSIGYSEDRFRKLYKKIFKVSPAKFLLESKIVQAKKYLKDGNLSLDEIAKKCGFNSVVVFINVFKRYLLMTPGQYRKITQENSDFVNIENFKH